MIELDPQSRASAWLERAWLERYLERTLDEDEIARFEAYALDKPELLREIDADTAVRDSLAAASPQQLAAGTPAAAADAAASTAPARRSLMPWFAAAASLLLGLALGQLGGDGAASVQASPGRVVFDTLRGEGLKARWDTVAAGKDSLLIVDVAVASDAHRITARLPDGRELELRPSAEGFATFIAPRALLVGKKVQISVIDAQGRKSQERVLEFGEGG